ncbi:MAG: hypothetical protein U5N58_03645 [Actinomycetota bacterium]|nr:hypothetical protein [Actinomycetota bacterium]
MEKIDFWSLSERIRLELDEKIDFLALHPKLCEEDGERFLGQVIPGDAIVITSACAEKKQRKLLRDGFENAGVDMNPDHWIPINMAQEDTNTVFEKIKNAVQAGPSKGE